MSLFAVLPADIFGVFVSFVGIELLATLPFVDKYLHETIRLVRLEQFPKLTKHDIFGEAMESKNFPVLDFLIELGYNSYHRAYATAATNNNPEMFTWLTDKFPPPSESSLLYAVKNNLFNAVKFLFDNKIISSVDEIIYRESVSTRNLEITKYLTPKLISEDKDKFFTEMKVFAIQKGATSIIQYLFGRHLIIITNQDLLDALKFGFKIIPEWMISKINPDYSFIITSLVDNYKFLQTFYDISDDNGKSEIVKVTSNMTINNHSIIIELYKRGLLELRTSHYYQAIFSDDMPWFYRLLHEICPYNKHVIVELLKAKKIGDVIYCIKQGLDYDRNILLLILKRMKRTRQTNRLRRLLQQK